MGRENLFSEFVYRFFLVGVIGLYTIYQIQYPEDFRYKNREDGDQAQLDIIHYQKKAFEAKKEDYEAALKRQKDGYLLSNYEMNLTRDFQRYLAEKKKNTSSVNENKN